MTTDHYYLMSDECLFQYNTGSHATPVWSNADNAYDANFDLQKGEYERKPNASPYTMTRGTKKSAPLSFNYEWATTDPLRLLLLASFDAGTPINFLWSDLPITDSNATIFSAWFEIMKFPLPKKVEEGVMIAVEAKITDYAEGGNLILPSLTIPS